MPRTGAVGVWWHLASSIGRGVLTVCCACSAVFLLLAALPGDAARVIAGADEAAAAELREKYGLTDPAWTRLVDWWQGTLSGNLGTSFMTGQDVFDIVGPALVRTFWVAIPAWCTAVLLGWLIAALMAWFHGTKADSAANTVVGVSVGLPEAVWIAAITFIVAVWLKLVPAVSLLPPGTAPIQVPELLILPWLCLTIPMTAWTVRLLRGVAEDVAASAAVHSARVRRTPWWFVMGHMVLRPMVGSVAQVAASIAVLLIGGSVIVEAMLSYDGIGRVLAAALQQRDVPVVMGAVLIISSLGVIALTVADSIATGAPRNRRVRGQRQQPSPASENQVAVGSPAAPSEV